MAMIQYTLCEKCKSENGFMLVIYDNDSLYLIWKIYEWIWFCAGHIWQLFCILYVKNVKVDMVLCWWYMAMIQYAFCKKCKSEFGFGLVLYCNDSVYFL